MTRYLYPDLFIAAAPADAATKAAVLIDRPRTLEAKPVDGAITVKDNLSTTKLIGLDPSIIERLVGCDFTAARSGDYAQCQGKKKVLVVCMAALSVESSKQGISSRHRLRYLCQSQPVTLLSQSP